MKVSINAVEQGFQNWFAKEVATMSWGVMMLSPIIPVIISNFKAKYMSVAALMLDGEGLLDLTTLHKEYSAILNAKGSVELIGIKFTTQDLDKMVEYIKNAHTTEIPVSV